MKDFSRKVIGKIAAKKSTINQYPKVAGTGVYQKAPNILGGQKNTRIPQFGQGNMGATMKKVNSFLGANGKSATPNPMARKSKTIPQYPNMKGSRNTTK